MRTVFLIVALAALLTGLNALKPLHIDDATFYFNAAHIAAHPLDPYGFVMLRWSDVVPALHALAPPGLTYWWAGAIRLFGDQPVLWKLWLFPFALLFVASLAALLRRFAPSVAAPLLVLLVLSPVFLPSLNLMMDIPALALSLTALAVFLRACDRGSVALAVLAGVTAGLAMQTKYTGFLAPAVLLAYALLHRKMRLGLSAALTAGLVFAAWETALFFHYGESHFVYQVFHGENGDQPKSTLLGALFPLLGGTVPTLALLALTVLRSPRWLLCSAALFVFLSYLLLWPDGFGLAWSTEDLSLALFACTGGGVLLSTAAAAWRLGRQASRGEGKEQTMLPARASWFLILWLALEIAGYVAISPFPAVRRIMGVAVAATLLVGRLADRTALEPRREKLIRGLAAVTAGLGIGFFAVDYLEARAEQQAAYAAADQIRQEHPHVDIWYAGYWGFQYYAEKCGMKQIIPLQNTDGESPTLRRPSQFHEGDWLVIPDENIPQQEVRLDEGTLETKGQLAIGEDGIPVSTVIDYYAGSAPLRHHSGPRIVLRLFRVADDRTAP
ncbi:MAG TPA: glycosyltransferase family 39 protein [Gemmataceae bacterium]|nr:glycosyltransferase family 39 protein [Gemmataceae bacterium]